MGSPSTSHTMVMPALAAISVPMACKVAFSHVLVRFVARKALSAGTDTAEMVPSMGHQEKV